MAADSVLGVEDKNLTRIAALLRKAEGTDNEHEADAYLQAAQRLATLSSVDLAVARSHACQQQKRATPSHRVVTVGESGKRGLRTYVQLFLAIGRANNLTCDIARDSTRVYAYGFESDIDAVEALYACLVVQMVRASDGYIKSGEYAEQLVYKRVSRSVPRRDHRGRLVFFDDETRPVHATTARINFQQAFAERIGARLKEAGEQAQEQAVNADRAAGTAGVGVAIAIRDKEIELLDHYKANSRARGSWSGNRAGGGFSEAASRAGDRAGRTARLGGDRALGGSRAAIGG